MGFHGGNDTAENANAYMGLTTADPVLYIYPQAGPFADAWAGWNVDPAGADFSFVDAVLSDLKSKNCVDSARVFATGKSNGGFFVSSLLCQRPASFKAAASVAGGGPQYNCAQPRAFMGVHGTADTSVPISTGRGSRDYWLAANHYANAAPVAVSPSPCVSYPGTLNPVVWCEHSAGHVWPTWPVPASEASSCASDRGDSPAAGGTGPLRPGTACAGERLHAPGGTSRPCGFPRPTTRGGAADAGQATLHVCHIDRPAAIGDL
jgi:polyhydroxybutyrate depolymerase